MEKHLIGAIATLMGTVIGAGFLGVPYVIAKSGVFVGLMHILVVGLAVIIMSLYVGEISLRTEGKHQLTGYATHYLGKWGGRFMLISMLVGIYGAMIAYLIGEGASLSALFGISNTTAILGFFVVGSVLILLGIRKIEGAEIYLNILRFAVLAGLFIFMILKFDWHNLTHMSPPNIMLPYGVILFALLGTAAIPELKEELANNKHLLKKAIIWGMLIPIIFYATFSVLVIGITGLNTTEIATIGLGKVLGEFAVICGNIFAIISMATAFLALGYALKCVFQYDYKLNKYFAWILTCFLPLIVAFVKLPRFIAVLGVTGALAGGIDGILLVFMHRKAKKMGERTPEFTIRSILPINLILILIFVGGIIYTLLTL